VAKRRADDMRSDDEFLRDRMEALIRRDDGPDGCWHWLGYQHPVQGPRVWTVNGLRGVHLETLRLAGRTLPKGSVWRRQCPNSDCVRPEHWQPITLADLARSTPIMAARIAQKACIRGHAFTPENTYRNPSGHRKCRECERVRNRQPERSRDRHVARRRKPAPENS
jgi:hypothetical protein